MRIAIEEVEVLLERLDEVDRKAVMFSSIAWRYAMTIGASTIRLQRFGDADDAQYSGMTADARADAIRRMETRIEECQELLGWAASQADPEYLPDPERVATMLAEPMEQKQGSDNLDELAKEMGITVDEAKELLAHNADRFAKEQDLQAMAARQHELAVVSAIQYGLDHVCVIDEVGVYDALLLVDRIAEKAAGYAFRARAAAIRTQRARRRATLNAEGRLLAKIEEDADHLLDRYTQLRDSTSDESPIEKAVKEMHGG